MKLITILALISLNSESCFDALGNELSRDDAMISRRFSTCSGVQRTKKVTMMLVISLVSLRSLKKAVWLTFLWRQQYEVTRMDTGMTKPRRISKVRSTTLCSPILCLMHLFFSSSAVVSKVMPAELHLIHARTQRETSRTS